MLKQRIVTAVFLAAFVAWVLFTRPAPQFGFFLVLATAVCAWEWSQLGNLRSVAQRIAYVILVTVVVAGLIFSPPILLPLIVPVTLVIWLFIAVDLKRRPVIANQQDKPAWSLLCLAAFLLTTAVASLYLALVKVSALYVLYIIAVVAAADIGAYFSGKRFGRRKLAIEISQGKTIEGAIGGMASVIVLTSLVLAFAPSFDSGVVAADRGAGGVANGVNGAILVAASLLAALLSVVGDLFISRAKRTAGVKDSGVLLPGHGGVLDRFDGLLAATPCLVMPLIWAF